MATMVKLVVMMVTPIPVQLKGLSITWDPDDCKANARRVGKLVTTIFHTLYTCTAVCMLDTQQKITKYTARIKNERIDNV